MKLRLWPDTLFGRLAMILVIGMFAGQLLTSTIWFDTHENRTLEMPARLLANRLADSLKLLEHAPDEAAQRALVQQLSDAHYQLQLTAAPVALISTPTAELTAAPATVPTAAPTAAPATAPTAALTAAPATAPTVALTAAPPTAPTAALPATLTTEPATTPHVPVVQRAVGDLIASVLQHRLGSSVDMRLLAVQLRDRHGRHTGILSLFDSNMPSGDFHLQVRLSHAVGSDGWLDVRANEGQAGLQSVPRALVLDYLVRIYLIRFTAVCLLAFVAVRFAVRPLRQLTKAADALGRNIYRPPLPVSGPFEVRSAAQSFNSMQQQLTESFAQRTRFLSAVSHDLRSPLTRLRLRVEMLPDAQWREHLRGDIDDMEAMVRATLDVVQGVEVTETRHDIDLDSMLEGLAADAGEAGHAVSVAGSAGRPVPGYPRNLKRCLQNLIDNAIRYGETAEVRVLDAGHSVQIVIGDRGPGIADATLRERVFEPYFRIASSHSEATGGTGLGLTIARSVAAAHGGTLTLRNRTDCVDRAERADGGLEAVLTLPREG